MANDYINPFSAVDTSAFGEGKTALETWFGYQKNQQAQPFIDMARQQGQLDLQKNQQGLMEYMSDPAKAARMSEFGATAAKNKYEMDTNPHKALADIQAYKDKISNSPYLNAEIRAKSDKYVRDFNHEPLNDFKAGLAGLGERLDQMPDKAQQEFMGRSLYPKLVEEWQRKYPNEKLPEHLKYFDKDTLPQIKIAQYTHAGVQERNAKERIEKMRNDSHERATGISANATITAGAAHDAASERNAERAYGSKENQAANSKAQHIYEARSKALQSIGYINAPDKEAFLQREEAAAARIYDTHGMKSSGITSLDQADQHALQAKGHKYDPSKYEYQKLPDGTIQYRIRTKAKK